MNCLYLDIFSGISGDMFVGALLDLGVDPAALRARLDALHLPGYHIHVSKQARGGIAGTKFDVHEHTHEHTHEQGPEHAHGHDPHHDHDQDHAHSHEHGHEHGPAHAVAPAPAHGQGQGHGHERAHGEAHAHTHEEAHDHVHDRSYADIRALIEASALSAFVRERALATFRRIAVAEAKVHGCSVEEVHFHEVGAIDSIVDIVAACAALELLGCPRVLAAPVVEGTGWVRCAHGRFPVPTAATLEILGARGIALTQCDEPHELVTPTGAAILAEFVEEFGPMRGLVARRVGYGLGSRENRTRPNVLRAVLGERVTGVGPGTTGEPDWETDHIVVIEANLDDVAPEVLGFVAQRALELGALDAFHTPVQMKKGRPGVVVTLLCAEADADRFTEFLMRETGTFGVRRIPVERRKLRRESGRVETAFGPIDVKTGLLRGQPLHRTPEYESCRAAALRHGVTLRVVYEAAIAALQGKA